MKAKRFLGLWVVVIFTVTCLCVPVLAIGQNDADAVVSGMTEVQKIARASGRIEDDIPGQSIVEVGDSFFMVPNETISYDCTYTPSNASIKFGFIAPDGLFYGLYGSDGSIDKTIRVSQRGSYTLAIKNYSDVTVTVSGTVNY